MTDATLTAAEGVSEVRIEERSMLGIPRSLYLYENIGVAPQEILARSLYLDENLGVQPQSVPARSLYLYENLGIEILSVLARSLYLYEATRDGEVFPWLMKLDPVEQYVGGQVDLFGDGFGELVEVAAGATITVDSVNASYIASNAVDRSTGSWVSNSNLSGAWIRFTFGSAKKIVAIALESAGNGWGVPEFRFSDGLGNVNGGTAVPSGVALAQYPVGTTRRLYTLPAPRTTTYVEIRVAGGGTTTFIGLYEVWILEDLDDQAETSRAWLNFGLVSVTDLGIVLWANRSPNLYPANSGVPITKAATVTLPAGATSGLVIVREET